MLARSGLKILFFVKAFCFDLYYIQEYSVIFIFVLLYSGECHLFHLVFFLVFLVFYFYKQNKIIFKWYYVISFLTSSRHSF
jgi:hypothetical protein